MKIEDTVIKTAGVMRCCIASFCNIRAKEVNLNDKAECEYCHTAFTLIVNPVPNKMPVWVPDWQINQK